MSASDDNPFGGIPPLIKDYLASLDRPSATVEAQLRATRGVMGWLRAVELSLIDRAREAGMTWEQIGEAQNRPRQVVHRQAAKTPRRPRVRGLTASEFDSVGTPDLRHWLKWWSDPDRDPLGHDEAGRDPLQQQRKLKTEIEARERLGVAGKDRDRSWRESD